ncbi:hypothetical protein [Rhodococcus sp. 06-235-1A]|uniref:hypothetical protein n=1 Tax=Rhodococcus sp. 06-235-1A TaxID=2022508 RepID=UPI0015C5C01A|nr:hypothetical protein [Rhodococcus sp. 06-235-1A]
MTPIVIGAAAALALILLTSNGSGLDFDRRSLAGAYRSARSRPRHRLRALRFQR